LIVANRSASKKGVAGQCLLEGVRIWQVGDDNIIWETWQEIVDSNCCCDDVSVGKLDTL